MPMLFQLSVAPIGSPKLSSKTDKENLQAVDEVKRYATMMLTIYNTFPAIRGKCHHLSHLPT